MRLARAKVKSLEDIPEYFKCCETQIQFCIDRREEGVILIDLDSIKDIDPGLVCSVCGADASFGKEVFVYNSNQPGKRQGIAHLDIFDIDEGLVDEQSI